MRIETLRQDYSVGREDGLFTRRRRRDRADRIALIAFLEQGPRVKTAKIPCRILRAITELAVKKIQPQPSDRPSSLAYPEGPSAQADSELYTSGDLR